MASRVLYAIIISAGLLIPVGCSETKEPASNKATTKSPNTAGTGSEAAGKAKMEKADAGKDAPKKDDSKEEDKKDDNKAEAKKS